MVQPTKEEGNTLLPLLIREVRCQYVDNVLSKWFLTIDWVQSSVGATSQQNIFNYRSCSTSHKAKHRKIIGSTKQDEDLDRILRK